MKTRIGITNRNKPFITRKSLDLHKAAAQPTPRATLGAVLAMPEPILFEDDGWGIYGTNADRSAFYVSRQTGGYVEEKKAEGHTLTHIGCDCDYPNWAMAHVVWDQFYEGMFVCTECRAEIKKETFIKLSTVYRFINNINGLPNPNWHI